MCIRNQGQDGGAKVRVVARACCRFPDGTTRTLYATRFSTGEMFILTVQPIQIGADLIVTLWPRGLPPLPPLEVRVISTCLDPAEAKESGFVAVIKSMDDGARGAIKRALNDLNLIDEVRAARPGIERRASPRVETDVKAFVEAGGARVEVRMVNLSMTGAFLTFDGVELPVGLDVGARVPLDVLDESAPEYVSLVAEVVRRAVLGARTGIGVRFVDVEALVAGRIEGIMLHVLGDLDGETGAG